MGYERWFFLLLLIVQPLAQVLEKKGMSQVGIVADFKTAFSFGTVYRMATNWYIVAGVLLSVAGIIIWLSLISNVKLSYISPFSALVFPIVAVMSYFVFNEPISVMRWTGIIVISLGCVLINLK